VSYKEWKDSNGYFHKQWIICTTELHREGAPAHIAYDPDGSLVFEEFWFKGRLHRDDGPAVIEYHPTGSIRSKEFFSKGKRNRELGSALIYYNEDGLIFDESFYSRGIFLGSNKEGFWVFWDKLTYEQRMTPDLLIYIARYS